MKAKIFTLIICIVIVVNLNSKAQDFGTGVTWGENAPPTEPLLINENFQGFTFFHSDSTSDMGNSNNSFDTDGETIIYGYKSDSLEVPILNSPSGKVKYNYFQCAFAPEWKTAWAFRDGVENTTNVSDGFIEISRTYGSNPPTVHGWFIVDLRAIEFVEVIQWTHSSSGGTKRGVMCEFSVDDGATWDTLRYQPGDALWGYSFTKDVFTREKTPNNYRCDPCAYGMTWEDGIWAENVMLRFGECGGQTARINDLKVYGTYTPPTAITQIEDSKFKIYNVNKEIRISEPAKVAVYTITGTLIHIAENTNRVSLNDYPNGIYLVNAQVGTQIQTKKIIINN